MSLYESPGAYSAGITPSPWLMAEARRAAAEAIAFRSENPVVPSSFFVEEFTESGTYVAYVGAADCPAEAEVIRSRWAETYGLPLDLVHVTKVPVI